MTVNNPWDDLGSRKNNRDEKKFNGSMNSDNFNKKGQGNVFNDVLDSTFFKFFNTSDLIKKLTIILIVVWLLTGLYIVKPEENAIVMRFGKFVRIEMPGLHYHLPYPVENIIKEAVTRIRILKIGTDDVDMKSGNNLTSLFNKKVSYNSDIYGKNDSNADSSVIVNVGNVDSNVSKNLMLTGDENMIDISFEIQWKISNLKNFVFNIKDRHKTIQNTAESVLREIVSRNKLSSILTDGRITIETESRQLLQQILNEYNAGVDIVLIQMLKADPPVQVIDSFRDVQTARVDKESEINKAFAYENNVVPNAKGEAGKILADAQSYAIQVVNDAKGNALKFDAVYDQYRYSPYLTRKRLYLDTIGKIFEQSDITIMDDSIKNVFLSSETLSYDKKQQQVIGSGLDK